MRKDLKTRLSKLQKIRSCDPVIILKEIDGILYRQNGQATTLEECYAAYPGSPIIIDDITG